MDGHQPSRSQHDAPRHLAALQLIVTANTRCQQKRQDGAMCAPCQYRHAGDATTHSAMQSGRKGHKGPDGAVGPNARRTRTALRSWSQGPVAAMSRQRRSARISRPGRTASGLRGQGGIFEKSCLSRAAALVELQVQYSSGLSNSRLTLRRSSQLARLDLFQRTLKRLRRAHLRPNNVPSKFGSCRTTSLTLAT